MQLGRPRSRLTSRNPTRAWRGPVGRPRPAKMWRLRRARRSVLKDRLTGASLVPRDGSRAPGAGRDRQSLRALDGRPCVAAASFGGPARASDLGRGSASDAGDVGRTELLLAPPHTWPGQVAYVSVAPSGPRRLGAPRHRRHDDRRDLVVGDRRLVRRVAAPGSRRAGGDLVQPAGARGLPPTCVSTASGQSMRVSPVARWAASMRSTRGRSLPPSRSATVRSSRGTGTWRTRDC